MSVRAVIFDIYGTLLEVGPPPADAPGSWERLWRDSFNTAPPLTLADFSATCDEIIARDHDAARARGIAHPEVFWADIACEALPVLRGLAPDARNDFLFQQSQLWHTVGLHAGAAETLRAVSASGLLLGIASNAQAYTVRELGEALADHGLGLDLFERALCFWSYEHGFSKPDAHVFRMLTARLRVRGITPEHALMVGDTLDNDIEPARAHGWQTWQLTPSASDQGILAGDWTQLASRLRGQS
jgi:FMN phosphatase YigB (HAD superfamily)